VEARLRAEAALHLVGRAPTYADLGSLPYSLNVIHEGLRMYPPAGSMARCALSQDELGGWPVPAGSVVLFSQYVTHRLPSQWARPGDFDPDRFAGGGSAQRPRYSYFPFGGGQRMCIGSNFALMEMQVALAMLTDRYHLEAWPGRTVDLRPAMDMYPRRPIMMRVVPRQTTDAKRD
jgi:cytochrome P450